jgi:hypothetical protein
MTAFRVPTYIHLSDRIVDLAAWTFGIVSACRRRRLELWVVRSKPARVIVKKWLHCLQFPRFAWPSFEISMAKFRDFHGPVSRYPWPCVKISLAKFLDFHGPVSRFPWPIFGSLSAPKKFSKHKLLQLTKNAMTRNKFAFFLWLQP